MNDIDFAMTDAPTTLLESRLTKTYDSYSVSRGFGCEEKCL